MEDAYVPDECTIFDWIESVVARGIRRPGYPADRWTENFCLERFRQLGLENVRLEPVTLPYWQPLESTLAVRAGGLESRIPCFPLPHSAPTDGLDAPLVPWRDETPAAVHDALALVDVPLMRTPADFPVLLSGAVTGEADTNWRRYDPSGTLAGVNQVLPFSRHLMAVMDASLAAGALGFVGALSDYPGNSRRYYVPYDAVARAIPGVWINGIDGALLRRQCDAGPVQSRLINRAIRHDITSYNIVGELPGADDESVIVGSHHDGPWTSAVEDASGVALVLAQATYWSRIAPADRPHRLVFLLNAGHMAGGAGVHAFIDRHRTELARVVLEVHLEHAASEIIERDCGLAASGHPEPRWWFTSRLASIEATVRQAIVAERLERSLIVPPDVFGPMPTSDGGPFHLAGVPLVNFLTAPFYLFDAMDTLDKIHRPSLVPLTRAAIRIIASTKGVSAVAMRG
jgi:hypothetical protein